MSRRTALIPLLALMLSAPIAAVVPGALADPPEAACSDTRPGQKPKKCPEPEPASQPADGTGTCLDVLGGTGSHRAVDAVGGLTRLDLVVGTGVCTDATYTLSLHDAAGGLLGTQSRTLGVDPAVVFAVPLPGYTAECVYGQVVVEQGGVIQEVAPDSSLVEMCSGSPGGAQNWR